ncbi:hypothetical protein YC2023_028956 [Brassica napus]
MKIKTRRGRPEKEKADVELFIGLSLRMFCSDLVSAASLAVVEGVNERLPKRRFASNHYPSRSLVYLFVYNLRCVHAYIEGNQKNMCTSSSLISTRVRSQVDGRQRKV